MGLVVLLLWKQREAGFYRRQSELAQESLNAVQALRQSEERLRLLLDSTAEAIYGLDLEGNCTFCNRSCLRFLGYDHPHDLIGKNMHRQIHHTHPDGTPYPVEECLIFRAFKRGDDVHVDEDLLFRADGTGVPVEFWSYPQRRDGIVVGAVVTFLDITDRRRAQDEIKRRNAELEMSNSDLDSFAHAVAHDLKDPLSTIIGHSLFLVEPDDNLSPARQRNAAVSILRIGRKMDSIIQELLLLAEVRKSEPIREVVRMAPVIAGAQERLADSITSSGAQLIIPEEWPLAVGYGPWVEELWVNFLSNALKYGGRPPVIELGATKQPDGMVSFWIRDNGVGIAPEHQSLIFAPFVRLGVIHTRGHGLGLSIARHITERLGGSVGVRSEVGQGSLFNFTLPSLDSKGEGPRASHGSA